MWLLLFSLIFYLKINNKKDYSKKNFLDYFSYK